MEVEVDMKMIMRLRPNGSELLCKQRSFKLYRWNSSNTSRNFTCMITHSISTGLSSRSCLSSLRDRCLCFSSDFSCSSFKR